MSTENGRLKSKLPSTLISPSALGMAISAAINCRQPIDIPQWSTLNEHYSVLGEESYGRKHGKDLWLGYFGIGIGGSRSIGSSNPLLEQRKVHQHKATDQNAFFPIPFLIREIGDDVDEVVRDRYRLRVVRQIGDKVYVMYYLRAINFDVFDPHVEVGTRDPITGNEDGDRYVYKKEDLSPPPYELTSSNSIPLTNRYVKGTGKMDLTLNADELNEIRNVCRVMFGDASVAAINEMYLVHGQETTNDGLIGEVGTVNYKELSSACTSFYLTEAWARDTNANTSLPWFFNYGNGSPLLIDMAELAG